MGSAYVHEVRRPWVCCACEHGRGLDVATASTGHPVRVAARLARAAEAKARGRHDSRGVHALRPSAVMAGDSRLCLQGGGGQQRKRKGFWSCAHRKVFARSRFCRWSSGQEGRARDLELVLVQGCVLVLSLTPQWVVPWARHSPGRRPAGTGRGVLQIRTKEQKKAELGRARLTDG